MSSAAFGIQEYCGVPYRRAGSTGLLLPVFSFGLWHGFGQGHTRRSQVDLLTGAFDRGITHFDNANRYGPPHGFAEEVLGRVLRTELAAHRDEITITTKAGNPVAPHPYGSGGSRKHLLDAVDASLQRLGTDHVDVFYSHRYDPTVPLEETTTALADIARQGKARYLGLSNYPAEHLARAIDLLQAAGAPIALYQPRYSLLDRSVERTAGEFSVIADRGVGAVVYSTLAQGLLTDRYADGVIPEDSRATWSEFLDGEFVSEEYLSRLRTLAELAERRGESIAQLALNWATRTEVVTSAILGASRVEQLDSNLGALASAPLDEDVLAALDAAFPASA